MAIAIPRGNAGSSRRDRRADTQGNIAGSGLRRSIGGPAAFPLGVHNLRLRPVAAFGIFLVPFALLVLPADLGGIATDLLLSRDDAGCLQRFGVRRECFGIDVSQAVSPAAVMG